MSNAVTVAKTTQPAYSDPSLHCTGMSPSTIALGAARESFLHAANYRRSGCLCIAERNDMLDNKYHVFYPAVTPPSPATTVNILFTIVCCPFYDNADVQLTIVDAAGTVTPDPYVGEVTSGTAPTGYGTTDQVIQYVHAADVNTSTNYNMLSVQVEGAQVHSFTAHMVPEALQSNAGVFNLDPGNFAAGMRMKGFNPAAGGGQSGSLDSLVQNQIAADANIRTFLSASRPCLWGWASGTGRFKDADTADYYPFMVGSFRPYVKPRNLTQGTDTRTVNICIAYRCNAGAKIKFTSFLGGTTYDTAEVTLTENTTAAPVMQIVSSGFQINPMGCEIKVEVYVTATAAVEIHAIAIFERSIGTAV